VNIDATRWAWEQVCNKAADKRWLIEWTEAPCRLIGIDGCGK